MLHICYNWCKIVGSPSLINRFDPFSLEIADVPHGYSPVEWWGTKWIHAVYLERTNNVLQVYFESECKPPIGFYEKIVKMYPEIELEYEYLKDGVRFYNGRSTDEREWHVNVIQL